MPEDTQVQPDNEQGQSARENQKPEDEKKSPEGQSANKDDNFEPEHNDPKFYADKWRSASEEAKRYRQAAAEERRKREEMETARLQEEGKHQELAEKYRKERDEALERATRATDSYARKTVGAQVRAVAAEMGCIDTDALVKLVNLDDIPVDDDFNVDPVSVKSILEKERKGRSYLFGKSAPKVHDMAPNPNPDTKQSEKTLDQMTMKEKMMLLKKKLKPGEGINGPGSGTVREQIRGAEAAYQQRE